MSLRFSRPQLLITIGLLLLILVAGELRFLRKSQHTTGTRLLHSEPAREHSSEEFGAALQRAGIATQATPSQK